MGRDPKPERTREEREPPGPMLRGKVTLSVSFIIAPLPGAPEPSAAPGTWAVQRDGGSGPAREDAKATVTCPCAH